MSRAKSIFICWLSGLIPQFRIFFLSKLYVLFFIGNWMMWRWLASDFVNITGIWRVISYHVNWKVNRIKIWVNSLPQLLDHQYRPTCQQVLLNFVKKLKVCITCIQEESKTHWAESTVEISEISENLKLSWTLNFSFGKFLFDFCFYYHLWICSSMEIGFL